jgi:hypothetical protein
MNDLRLCLRSLFRTPGFTVIVVTILALGIGANTAIFSVVDAAMLKPMPVADADRVVRLSARHPQAFCQFNSFGFQIDHELEHSRAFETIGAYVTGELNLHGSTDGRLRAAAVTPEFFDVMDRTPAMGRAFRLDDFRQSFHVAMISHQLWQSHFEGTRDVLGKQIMLGREVFTVVAVMPQQFELPEATQIWVPARWSHQVVNGGWVFPTVLARMRPGVAPGDARGELLRIRRYRRGSTYIADESVNVSPLRTALLGETRVIIVLVASGKWQKSRDVREWDVFPTLGQTDPAPFQFTRVFDSLSRQAN